MPIGAMLVKEKYADLLGPGEHASTFGGNAVCCAAANAVLDVIERDKLLENTQKMSNYLVKELKSLKKRYKTIKEIRGMGLLLGIELTIDAKDLVKKLIDNFVITVPAGKNVVRFTPPLIINSEELDQCIIGLNKALKELT
jgi:acetylornithine/succinyldiaminopimelate/putrescine aminotransferase